MNEQQIYNIKIANIILNKCFSDEGKHLRFNQILFNVGITEFDESVLKTKNDLNPTNPVLKDKYNESSKTTYNKLIKNEQC